MYSIMIDPVGGGDNHGLEHKGRLEKDDTLWFSNLLWNKLEDNNQNVLGLTRYGDENISVKERVGLIQFNTPDLLISIRRNTKDGLSYHATQNSIASNIMQLLSLKISDLYTSIDRVEYKSKILDTKSVLTLFINNMNSDKENKNFEKNSITLIDKLVEVINLIDSNSPETIKNIINGIKIHDVVLNDQEGYFLVGPHPGYETNIIWRGKSFNQAVAICNKHINLHVFRSNNPNAESLHKSNMKRLVPSSYNGPVIKYQSAFISSKNGARSFIEKDMKSTCVTTYTYKKQIKLYAAMSDADWIYVIDSENGNGYVPRQCVSI